MRGEDYIPALGSRARVAVGATTASIGGNLGGRRRSCRRGGRSGLGHRRRDGSAAGAGSKGRVAAGATVAVSATTPPVGAAAVTKGRSGAGLAPGASAGSVIADSVGNRRGAGRRGSAGGGRRRRAYGAGRRGGAGARAEGGLAACSTVAARGTAVAVLGATGAKSGAGAGQAAGATTGAVVRDVGDGHGLVVIAVAAAVSEGGLAARAAKGISPAAVPILGTAVAVVAALAGVAVLATDTIGGDTRGGEAGEEKDGGVDDADHDDYFMQMIW